MLHMTLTLHGEHGIVTAVSVTPDGKAIVRINDRWLFVDADR